MNIYNKQTTQMEKETRQNVSRILTKSELYDVIRRTLRDNDRMDVLDSLHAEKQLSKYNLLQLCKGDVDGIYYRLYDEVVNAAHRKYFKNKNK